MKDKVYKELEILDTEMPHDLKVAIETVFTQASIMDNYELDEIPIEYLQNLFDASSKYPMYDRLTQEVLDIIGVDVEFVDGGPLDDCIKDLPN